MANYVLVATEQEVEQAQREAEEIHQLDIVDAPQFDNRSETRQIRDKFRGFLGEIVLCRANKWKRNPPKFSNFDAEDPQDGRHIEVKVRSEWFRREIPVKPNSDLAVLLRYYRGSKAEHCFQIVKSFERSHLQSHGWNIFITREFWDACLQDKLIRDL